MLPGTLAFLTVNPYTLQLHALEWAQACERKRRGSL